MKEKQKVELGFYRLNRAIEASAVEKRGETEETRLEKTKKMLQNPTPSLPL